MEKLKMAAREAFAEIETLKRVGIFGKLREQRIKELEDLIEVQGYILAGLNREWGTNRVKLAKLRGEIKLG